MGSRVKCPLGCDMSEYRVQGWATGVVYGCQGGKSDATIFAKEYGGWLCRPAFVRLLEMRETKTVPDEVTETVKRMNENTRCFRAGLRPPSYRRAA
jgi:hypothetical protein